MKLPTNHQLIEHQGKPIAVVLPFDEYMNLIESDELDYSIPNDVLGNRMAGDSVIKAWRVYRAFSQEGMAEKMGITQSAYSQLENRSFTKARETTQKKLCAILDVDKKMMIDFESMDL